MNVSQLLAVSQAPWMRINGGRWDEASMTGPPEVDDLAR
jgi:hypothetical protein